MNKYINITDKEIDSIPFIEHGYQECDEEYHAFKAGIKWLRDKINDK